ncbi:MAG: hypothetical protein VB853_15320, partial [Pirellulales bacterium]
PGDCRCGRRGIDDDEPSTARLMPVEDGYTKPLVEELGGPAGTCNSNREKGPSARGMTIASFAALTGWIAMPGG